MRKSVLVVDDNAFIRQVLCGVFTSEAGFDVCGEAGNGQDALEKAQALHADLIVMDLSMPVMNGIDAARALKIDEKDLHLLERAAEKLVRFGKQVGVTTEEMILLLDSGISLRELLAFLASKTSGAA